MSDATNHNNRTEFSHFRYMVNSIFFFALVRRASRKTLDNYIAGDANICRE